MNLLSHTFSSRARTTRAFTMVEIAIALGVIAFAMIAIIGILPTGLQTQRDNREETIVTQDARLLVEAIRSGGRDVTSDLGAFVLEVDGTNYGPPGAFLETTNLISLLSDPAGHTNIIMSAVSGAVASRGTDFGFRYQIQSQVLRAPEFAGTVLADQVWEVRLRFAWPVLANNQLANEANRYVVRTLVSGWHTNGYLYAQQYHHP
jgi:type II secretory pathway pseudopilin PulG